MNTFIKYFLLSAAGILSLAVASAQDIPTILSDTPNPAEIATAQLRASPKAKSRPAVPEGLLIKSFTRRPLSAASEARLAANRAAARTSLRKTIPDLYMVQFEPSAFPYLHKASRAEEHLIDSQGFTLAEVADTLMIAIGGEVRRVHEYGNGAFSAIMSERQAATLSRMSGIANVAPVSLASFDSAPNWAQDRLNQHTASLDSNYTMMTDSGTTVHVYIVDSGVRSTHNDLSGRTSTGYAVYFTGNPSAAYTDLTSGSSSGHGTSVASCAAGTYYGVAPSATIHSVRLTDSNGDFDEDDCAAGLDWVRQNFTAPAVANCSWEVVGGSSQIDTAAQALHDAGVTVVVAAGNGVFDSGLGYNVGTTVSNSPAAVSDLITVGATNSSDVKSVFSNYGNRVDIYAPGENIEMPIATSDSASITRNGTSFASPLVAGIAALYLKGHPSATPDEVRGAIVAASTRGIVTSIPSGQTNRPDLAYANRDWLDVDQLIVAGSGSVVGTNISHPNGNLYDQVLLTGTSVTAHSDYNQVLRVSWIDENDDIVMAELAGPGNIKITLENSSGPALPQKYNQTPSVYYMKGRASIEVSGTSSGTYFNSFSVGTANAVDQTIFITGVSYDGIADLKNLTFVDTPAIGGILNGNVIYRGDSGTVGIFSPPYVDVKVTNRLSLRDIKASSSGAPFLLIGYTSTITDFGGKPIIGGGDLIQPNGAKIRISDLNSAGFTALITNANADSHGNTTPPLALSSARLGPQYGSSVVSLPYSTTDSLGYTPPASGYTASQ